MADVEDRGSAIRVERLTAIPVGAKGYVKIETNMGVTGWGEINNMNTKVACALAESLVSSTECRCIACWAGRVATRCGCIPVRRRSR